MHSADGFEQEKVIPRLASSWDPSDLELSPEEGFLLSRIDGYTSWTLLRQIGGIAPEEVDRCIEHWLSAGVVVIDEDKPDSAEVCAQDAKPKPESGPVDFSSDLRIDSSLDLAPELQAQILEFETFLDKPYFELLDVPRDADNKQIKRAYFSLSKIYHPDRYFRANLGDYSARLERIFRKLVEAYELLSDPATRAEVERRMGPMLEPEPEPEPQPVAEVGEVPERKLPPRKLTKRQTLERLRRHFRIPPQILAERKLQARHFYEAAMVAAKRERWHEAAPSLRLAITFDPWNDEYRARFSDTLSHHYEQQASKLLDSDDGVDPADKNEALRLLEEVLIHRPADAEVNHRTALLALDIRELERATEYAEAACELCPESAEMRLTLARVHCANGMREKAKKVLAEAAEFAPKNEEVQAEIQRLRRPRRSA